MGHQFMIEEGLTPGPFIHQQNKWGRDRAGLGLNSPLAYESTHAYLLCGECEYACALAGYGCFRCTVFHIYKPTDCCKLHCHL